MRSVKGAARRALSADARARKVAKTADSFQNSAAKLGIGTDNLTSASTYGFNPITRQQVMLEWIHRGSWLGGVAIDLVANDMTRAGVDLQGEIIPSDIEALEESAIRLGLWKKINSTVKWARLYGGCIAVMLIDGQRSEEPLRVDRVGKGQFKGLLVLDRWMVDPSLNDLITELGPNMGLPKYYTIFAGMPAMPRMKVHYSRCLRLEGVELPYSQRLTENLWSLSVLERLYDRMVAFDSATTGAAQLVYKAYLRTIKIKGLREIAGGNATAQAGLIKYVDMMRRFQTMEGMTIIDGNDEFGEHGASSSFSGLRDVLEQFGQQIAGALQIPLVRLFGQSPGGLNSSGDSDLRTYYDGIKHQQEDLRVPVTMMYQMLAQSEGIKLPENFRLAFRSLWQMDDEQKAKVAETVARAVTSVEQDGTISKATALKELRQSSHSTGIFTNITDEEIEAADQEPQMPGEQQFDENGNPIEPEGGGGEGPAVDDDSMRSVSSLKNLHGLDFVVENPKGSIRSGSIQTGNYVKQWSVQMPEHYGYLRVPKEGAGLSGKAGADGGQIDAFVGPDADFETAFIIDQRDLATGQFDEHKILLAFPDREAALKAYVNSYSDGRGADRIGSVSEMNVPQLSAWLETHDFSKPASGWFGKTPLRAVS